jgi:SAM-dependent methyltransferase
MNEKRIKELQFWKSLYQSGDLDAIRDKDKVEKTKFFGEMEGKGLDLGCGIVSIFEGQDNVIAIDPLMDEYDKVLNIKHNTPHLNMDGEKLDFKDDEFDWVFCVNVIDHTPNPEKMISEIRRVLKPGGRLYFSVNFDSNLGAEHYKLWRISTVLEYFKDFNLIKETLNKNPHFAQSIYQGIYI